MSIKLTSDLYLDEFDLSEPCKLKISGKGFSFTLDEGTILDTNGFKIICDNLTMTNRQVAVLMKILEELHED